MRSQPSNTCNTRLILTALVVAWCSSLSWAQVSSAQGNTNTQSKAQTTQRATENANPSQDAQDTEHAASNEQAQEQAKSTANASINRSWRIIAHWIALRKSHVSRQIVVDRKAHISRPLSNPQSHGWRVSLPTFSRNEVHMPPAAAARQKLQARSTSHKTNTGEQASSQSTTQADAGASSDD